MRKAVSSEGIPCFNGKLVRKLKGKLPSEHVLDETRGLFSALSDQTRIKLLLALGADRELCVCDLAHVAGTTVSTARTIFESFTTLGS